MPPNDMTDTAFRRYDFLLFALCGLAGLLYGIDMGIVAAALPYLRATCGFTEAQLSSVVAAVLLGCIPGTVLAAWVAERIGRLTALKLTAVVFAVAVPVICLSDGSFWMMFAGRTLQGVGCGFMGVSASLYVVESATSATRGRGTGMIQFVLCVGLVVAALIGLCVTHFFGVADSDGVSHVAKTRAWQTMFWISIVPTLALFGGLFRLKESPRWLFAHGRRDDAYASLCMNHTPETALRILDDLEAGRQCQSVRAENGSVRLDSIFQRKYLVPLALAILVPVLTQATGVNSLMNYSVVLMQRAGLSGVSANWADTLIKSTNLLFTFLALGLVDRKGRRFLLAVGTAGVLVGLVAVGALFRAIEAGSLAAVPTTGWLIAGAFVLFMGGFAFGPGVCVWLAMTELVPLRMRAGGLMVAQCLAMVVSYALAQTYLPWSKALGDSSVFLTLSVFGMLYFLLVVLFLPETKGKSLEEIERHFAGKKAVSPANSADRACDA